MQLDFAAEPVALLRRGVELSVHIKRHQFFTAGVPEHAHEGIITIEQLASRRGYENPFMHLLE